MANIPAGLSTSDRYKVRVIKFISPHLIWVEKEEEKKDANTFQQIGMIDVLPINKITKTLTAAWNEDDILHYIDLIVSSKELYFAPVKTFERLSLIEGVLAIFGKLYVGSGAESYEISEDMVEMDRACYNPELFNENILERKAIEHLDGIVIKSVWQSISNRKRELGISVPIPRQSPKKKISQNRQNIRNPNTDSPDMVDSRLNMKRTYRATKLNISLDNVTEDKVRPSNDDAGKISNPTGSPVKADQKPISSQSSQNDDPIHDNKVILKSSPPSGNRGENNRRQNVQNSQLKAKCPPLDRQTENVDKPKTMRPIYKQEATNDNLRSSDKIKSPVKSIVRTNQNSHQSKPDNGQNCQVFSNSIRCSESSNRIESTSKYKKTFRSVNFNYDAKKKGGKRSTDSKLDDTPKTASESMPIRNNDSLNDVKTLVVQPDLDCSLADDLDKSEDPDLDVSDHEESKVDDKSLILFMKPSVFNRRLYQQNFIESDKLCTPKRAVQYGFGMLVHSKTDEIFSKWSKMSETLFHHFYKRLCENFVPNLLQSFVWPRIVERRNMIIVDNMCGKTLSVVLPICNLISKLAYFNNVQSPRALLIYPDNERAIKASELFKETFGGMKKRNGEKFNVLCIDNSVADTVAFVSLFENHDILITTPLFVNLLKYASCPYDLKRVEIVVFENFNLMSDCHKEIQDMLCAVRNIKKQYSTDIQLVITSSHWIPEFETMLNYMNDPVICINSLAEAILYSKMKVNVHFVNATEWKNSLYANLKNPDGFDKTVIFCPDKMTASDVARNLNMNIYEVIVITDVITDESLMKDYHLRWSNSNKKRILITVDLNNCAVFSDALRIIHIMLPSTSKIFNNRFAYMLDNYKNVILDTYGRKLHVDIYITQCYEYLRICDIVNRTGCNLPDETKRLERASNRYLSRLKTNQMEICKNLLSFGKCSVDDNICRFRHTITDSDKAYEWIPQNGYVKFKLLDIIDVGCYTARLINHINFDGKSVNVQQNNLLLALRLSELTSDRKNLIPVKKFKFNEMYLVQFEDKFYRCLFKHRIDDSSIQVELIDRGIKIYTRRQCMYLLPENLKTPNTNVIQIRLANIRPRDKSTIWNHSLNQDVMKELSTEGVNVFMRGRIVLALGNTLWLDSVQKCSLSKVLNKNLILSNVKRDLIDKQYVVDDPNCMPLLYDLCKDFIKLPEYNLKIQHVRFNPRWAYLESDNLHQVYFSVAVSTGMFYIRLIENDDKLNKLNEDLQNYAAMTSVSKFKYGVGDYCIALFSADGRYYRAQIVDVIESELSELSYKCFFVDFGDYDCVKSDSVLSISARIVDQLPFQAIECRLVGIQPIEKDWSEQSLELLYENCFESSDDNISKILYSRMMFTEKSERTSRKYCILLYNCSDKYNILNRMFVDNNLAKYVDSEKFYVDHNEIKPILDESQSSDSFVRCEGLIDSGVFEDLENVDSDFSLFEELSEEFKDCDFDDSDDVSFEKESFGKYDCVINDDTFFNEEFGMGFMEGLPDLLQGFYTINEDNEAELIEVPNNFNDENLPEVFK